MIADSLPLVLGLAWGALVAAPLAQRARRLGVSGRFERSRRHRLGRWVPSWRPRVTNHGLGPVGRVIGALVGRRAAARREEATAASLPVVVDLLAVAVGAGCTPYLAVDVAAQWAPPPLASALDDVRQACTLGAAFADALGDLAATNPALRPLVDALLASDRYGAPVGDALARLAGEERAAVRRRAEARARTVPVRLLFPLVFLVLPAFGLLTVLPSLLAGFRRT